MSPELCAEALFVSPLQPSEDPTIEQVSSAIEATILLHGSEGCAEVVAQEYGDHPQASAERMSWCLGAVHNALTVAA
jgi:hypothetical protein